VVGFTGEPDKAMLVSEKELPGIPKTGYTLPLAQSKLGLPAKIAPHGACGVTSALHFSDNKRVVAVPSAAEMMSRDVLAPA
jgi:hypothetical protein